MIDTPIPFRIRLASLRGIAPGRLRVELEECTLQLLVKSFPAWNLVYPYRTAVQPLFGFGE